MLSRKVKALSIMEMMIASLLVVISFVSLLQMHNYSLAISTKAKEIATASEDAADIMEKFNAADFASLNTEFPDNCCIGAAIDCDSAPGCPGGDDIVPADEMLLNNEKIEVSYPLGTSTDPRGVVIKVSWVGKDGRQHRDGGDAPPVVLTNIDTRGM